MSSNRRRRSSGERVDDAVDHFSKKVELDISFARRNGGEMVEDFSTGLV